ncbi:7-carboxy-7-deazaguanine synthase QueE [Merismopedia glauca]|uniref:7-carboxy-7-deazaguanine synthase n=1 Tax=Merismopedia glauca CCAP 1448/3 TaxID=1296344 RepID=A0A2T1BZX3_9CYAN|nr:7-carboxy-7-deazaguanine synthase QueE [Merismopedia glauca]PSB01423.1 radical SAM protein [Merismopedia glauca CCAP 1448/3]
MSKLSKYKTANLIEVFSAIQGEGLNIGTRQIFIRFAMCDLRCHYCDSAHTWYSSDTCRIEQNPGKRDFATYPNPVTLDSLISWIRQQNQPGLHDSISLTGGEPLLHAAFLQEFLPQLHQETDLPIYLETGGHRPSQLKMILPYLDSIGMDIKLPSVSGELKWEAHQEFLQLCAEAKVEVFGKIIISEATNPQELEQAATLIAQINPQIPVFLQPVTPLASSDSKPINPPTPEQVLTWQTLMKKQIKQVRVIPQTHKMIDQL